MCSTTSVADYIYRVLTLPINCIFTTIFQISPVNCSACLEIGMILRYWTATWQMALLADKHLVLVTCVSQVSTMLLLEYKGKVTTYV